MSVRYDGGGRFRFYNKDDRRETDAAPKSGEKGFLEGRFAEPIRPLCFFDRPGVLLFSDDFGPAVIIRYDHLEVAYAVRTAQPGADEEQQQHQRMVDPVDMVHLVARIGQRILVKAASLRQGHAFVREQQGELEEHEHTADVADDARVVVTLRVPDEDTLDGLVPIHVRAFPSREALHADMDMEIESMEDDRAMRMPPLALHVPIEDVLGALDGAPAEPFLFDGVCAR